MMAARLLFSLSPREREGPNAERWEGEGKVGDGMPLTLPLLRSGPLPLPRESGKFRAVR